MTRAWSFAVRGRCLAGLFWLGAGLLAGCGGGGGSGGATAPPVAAASNGQLMIGVRDAAGDFLRYVVDVTSLRFERANGDVVETIPTTSRIDFAQLTDLTEFFTVATVPAGVYTRVVVNLDFTNAEIVVQDANGAALPATAIGADGRPLTTLAVAIRLPDEDPVRILPAAAAAVTLDFDLAASNTVDIGVSPAKVTVEPTLSVIPRFETDRAHRVRGVLASVDKAAASVTLKVRPFHLRQGEFGRLTFATDADTRFEIDGVASSGSAGLDALAALPADTPVVAGGTVADRKLTADVVLAGSSVPWANGDVASGVVTARSGDTLTVKGANVDFANGANVFRGTFQLRIGDATRVTAPGVDSSALGKASISVGARVVAFGSLTTPTVLDATQGRVRLEITGLAGDVVQVNPLVVRLSELGGLRPGAFDFAGTGAASATDADPARYEIDSSALGLQSVAVDDVVRIRGFVHTFGAAPPDFDARTVVDVDTDSNGALLWSSWRAIGGTTQPFATIAPGRIDVDLTRAQHVLKPASGTATDRIALVAPDGQGTYVVVVRGAREIRQLHDFAALTRELTDRLNSGNRLVQIVAVGRYNAGTLELTTPRAAFEFVVP